MLRRLLGALIVFQQQHRFACEMIRDPPRVHDSPFIVDLGRALASKNLSTDHMRVLGVGHGTTATHSLYKELCAMNYSAWHWGLKCNSGQVRGKKSGNDFGGYLGKRSYHAGESTLSFARHERTVAINDIADLAEQRTEAFLDSPTYYIYDELRAAFPQAFYVLTVREPVAWAKIRLENHGKKELICLESTNPNITKGDSALRSSPGEVPIVLPPLPHAYALQACVERAALRASAAPEKPALPPIITYENLAQRLSEGPTLKILADTYVGYNDHVRKTAPLGRFVEVNFWEHDGCKFHATMEAALRRTVAKPYRGTVVGTAIEAGELNRQLRHSKLDSKAKTGGRVLVSHPCPAANGTQQVHQTTADQESILHERRAGVDFISPPRSPQPQPPSPPPLPNASVLAFARHSSSFKDDLLKELASSQLSTRHLQVLGVGHGTTATHSLYEELCAMGFSAWHWAQRCGKGQNKDKKMFGYLGKRSYQLGASTFAFASRERKVAIDDILELSKERIEALVDSPTFYIYDELRSAFSDAFYVLTVRNASEWAKSRFDHHGDSELVCRESAAPTISENDFALRDPRDGSFVTLPVLPHAFALRACAERASLRAVFSSSLNVKRPMSPLVTYKGLLEILKSESAALAFLEKVYNGYNAHVRKTAPKGRFMEVNFWEDDGCEFHLRIEAALNRTVASPYRGSVVGTAVQKTGSKAGGDVASAGNAQMHRTNRHISKYHAIHEGKELISTSCDEGRS